MNHRLCVKRIIKQSALIVFCFILFLSLSVCRTNSSKPSDNKTDGTIREKLLSDDYPDDIKIQSFQNSDSSWGFNIYLNGKIYIHQQVKPGEKSDSGFQTESDAEKAAEFVSYKIKRHITPESISEHELDSLGLTKKNEK